MTTDLLGFSKMNYNVIYAQMGRGKVEKIVSYTLSNLAGTLSKLAFDVCLFMSQNFNFVNLPSDFTTGSSIMPHKKNPDVFELIRAKCNKLQGVPNQISLMTNNLPSGYFRDLQMVKEVFLPSFKELNDCLNIATLAIDNMTVKENILDDKKYDFIFSVEAVNNLVLEGIPFREAYKIIGEQIESGNFIPKKEVKHTHEGSIGNLSLDKISDYKNEKLRGFKFEEIETAIKKLLV
jgi:argininosuccinate lyase